MKSAEFVKKYGWDHSKDVAGGWITNYENIDLNNLQNLVNAYELVESFGGLEKANSFILPYTEEQLSTKVYYPMVVLKQAIELVESCT